MTYKAKVKYSILVRKGRLRNIHETQTRIRGQKNISRKRAVLVQFSN